MVYVDLKPIRANMTKIPEDPDYIFIQLRIRPASSDGLPKDLLLLVGGAHLNMPKGLSFQLDQYLGLA
ncbi:hypothetical protein [Microbulbifer sp. JTAC008]|uniref:hypothetical protein n=1 Tax=unclassified Microbulbifer TaxID=2619833 RepID=UPI00403A371A